MSAAATAAGYLYASGRLRGRGAREQDDPQQERTSRKPEPREHQRLRVAVLPQESPEERQQPQKPRREPKIEYRVRRRWSAE